MEVNDEPEASNDEDSLPLGGLMKKWNEIFDVEDVEPFTGPTGSIGIKSYINQLFFPLAV